MESGVIGKNNFDLLRLFAASQVVMYHYIEHFHINGLNYLKLMLLPFPGVPIFFFISGLLISNAWEKNQSLYIFFKNRFLRIFPGLWLCILFSCISVFFFYDKFDFCNNVRILFLWILCQSTIFQMWNPDFLRDYGIGVLNGSLWTISVELSFYFFVPLIYFTFHFLKYNKNTILLVLIFCSFSLNYLLDSGYLLNNQSFFRKVIMVTFLPWIGMFLMGILIKFHLQEILAKTKKYCFQILFSFLCISLFTIYKPIYPLLSFGNSIGIVNYLILVLIILIIAFTNVDFAEKLLKKNDISYGIYIYHQPVLNMVLSLGLLGYKGLGVAIFFTLFFSILSWRFCEKYFLNFKTDSFHKR